MPLISVVLPVYNVEKYIEECMNSILNQTIQDFEILVIDDCSTDKTLAIINSFNDERIRIIQKEKNKGLIDSLNIGFKKATGTYIARVDGDDRNSLDRFEKQISFLKKNLNIHLCGSWMKAFGTSSKVIKQKEFHREIVCNMLLNNPINHPTVMMRSSLFKDSVFNEKMIHAEDYDFWARIAFITKLHNLQEVLYYYRTHEKQVSTQFKDVQLKNDILIKLSLFKKIPYNQTLYTDVFITKVLFTDQYISIKELKTFIAWTKELEKKNTIFDKNEFKKVINILIRKVTFDTFFKPNGRKEITKKWRIKALTVLPVKEVTFILTKKIK